MAREHGGTDGRTSEREGAARPDGTLKRRGLVAAAAALVAGLAVRGGTDAERVAADDYSWSMPYTSGTQNRAGVLAGFYNNGIGTALTGSSSGHGVLGNTNAVTTTQYAGVFGIGNGGSTYGVYGYGLTTGTGVIGTSGNSTGVNGQSTGGTGVVGQSTSDVGVRGYSGNSYGMFGSSGSGTGVYGISGDSGNGVRGFSQNFHGLFGETNANPASPSVYPVAGVFGLGYNANTAGVTGSNYGGVGVSGYSAANTGVIGRSQSGIGVYGTTAAPGGSAVYGSVTARGAAAITGSASSGAYAAAFTGPVVVNGDFVAYGGAKSAAVPHPDGSHRLLYCEESTESWFSDYGEGTLTAGKADVKLDPDFAAVVDTGTLHVFLTPHDEHHLHLAGRAAGGFSVTAAPSTTAAAAGKKAGDLNGVFSFRVVAKRKDIAAPRLAKYDVPQALKPAMLPPDAPAPKDEKKPAAVMAPPPPSSPEPPKKP